METCEENQAAKCFSKENKIVCTKHFRSACRFATHIRHRRKVSFQPVKSGSLVLSL